MARSDQVLRKDIEQEEEGLGPEWPAPTGLQTALTAGSGYAKYGTKQDSIEGALEELNDMINNYNSDCSMQKEKQQD
jgi:hypothetical protein